MVTIAMPDKAKKIKTRGINGVKWCYLGKNTARREAIARILGEENRYYLKGRLQRIALDLSSPYIDFVASLGKRQREKLNWWAGKFSSKMPMQTDFFLLLCYKAVMDELIDEKQRERNLVVFVEDNWLFADLKSAKSRTNLAYVGSPNLSLAIGLGVLRGILRRVLLLGWFIIAKSLMFLYRGNKKPGSAENPKQSLCIINPAEPRAFKGTRYVNNYMPGLPEFCKKRNITFFYLYLLRFPLLTLKNAGINKNILWPLIFDAKASDIVKRLSSYWKPVLDKKSYIGNQDVSFLLRREFWLEFSSAGFNAHLMLFDALNAFFRKAWCKSVIYVFENQTWEKMLCMAAKENNVNALGYQHSSVWKLFLSHFIGKEEESFMPLPHKLITSGKYFARLYKEARVPDGKIVVGGSWKYIDSMANRKRNIFTGRNPASKRVVLVSLNIDMRITKSMLTSITKMLSKTKLADELEFRVKPHPGSTPYELHRLSKFISKFKVVGGPFDRLLDDVDIVIASTSTSGLEAFLHGKNVISYVPENLIAADPLSDMDYSAVHKWHEGEELDINLLKNFPGDISAEEIDKIKERYFGGIDQKVWLECLTGGNKNDNQ